MADERRFTVPAQSSPVLAREEDGNFSDPWAKGPDRSGSGSEISVLDMHPIDLGAHMGLRLDPDDQHQASILVDDALVRLNEISDDARDLSENFRRWLALSQARIDAAQRASARNAAALTAWQAT